MAPREWSVLIVDDDAQFGRLLANVAEKCEFRPLFAASALEAWKAMTPQPSLVLLDLSMPGVDGIEMLREFSFRRCAARIHVMSGTDARVLRTAVKIGRELGLEMGEPLSKPFSVAQLREVFASIREDPALPVTPSAAPVVPAAVPGLLTAAELRRAIGRGEIVVAYQPILDLTDLSPCGAEALVRWQHPEHGLLMPADFIPLALASGVIGELTECIYFQALEFAGRPQFSWSGRPLAISINLATTALVGLDFAALLSSFLASSGVAAERLIVEVTESELGVDRTSVLEVLSRLRLRGVQVSIDDFGTGTSSLERVDQWPCTELKIERAFIGDVVRRAEAKAIVRTTLEMARQLDLRVVAEGVEDVPTLRWLRSFGCQTAQGFLFAPGLAEDAFQEWLEGWELQRESLSAATTP